MTISIMNPFTKKVADLPDNPSINMSTAELKDWFDATSEEIRSYLNTDVIPGINNVESTQNILKQAIINGNFSINQRAVSGTVTLTAGKYGHDRWKAGASGCSYTFSKVNNVTTITILSGTLKQVIEGVNLFDGTYTLSWGGTAQGKIGVGLYGDSGITGMITGGNDITVEFGVGTLKNVQFNFGNKPSSFVPKSYLQELTDCRRYYYRYSGGGFNRFCTGQNFSTTNAYMMMNFPVPMRVPPTLTYSGTLVLLDTSIKNISSVASDSGSINNMALNVTSSVALTIGYGTQLIVNNDSNTYIAFDAEL